MDDLLMAKFALQSDSGRSSLLRVHPELQNANVIDAYLAAARAEEDPVDKLAEPPSWLINYGNNHLAHACSLEALGLRYLQPDRDRSCYCGTDLAIRNASAAFYLAGSIRDSHRQTAARLILAATGLRWRGDLRGVACSSPLIFQSKHEGHYTLALGLRDRFELSLDALHSFDIDNSNEELKMQVRYWCPGFGPIQVISNSSRFASYTLPVPAVPLSSPRPPSRLSRLLHSSPPQPVPSGSAVLAAADLSISAFGTFGAVCDLLPHAGLVAVGLHPAHRLGLLFGTLHVFRECGEPPRTLEEMYRLETTRKYGNIRHVAFEPTGSHVYVHTSGVLSCWRLIPDVNIVALALAWEVPFEADHMQVVPGGILGVVSNGKQRVLSWYHHASGQLLRKLAIAADEESKLTVSPDGRFVAVLIRGDYLLPGGDYRVEIRDTNSGREYRNWHVEDQVGNLKYRNNTSKRVASYSGKVTAEPRFDGKSTKLAIGIDRGGVLVFNLADSRARALHGHSAPVSHVALSPDGRLLVSVSDDDGTITVWSA